jgi:putative SOS response-associated peptidase YedK
MPRYRITLKDGEPFAMACLGEWWRRGEQRIESFTIIVTSANELSRRIHDRMPVILHPDTWDAWLTAKDAERHRQSCCSHTRPAR